MLEPWERHLLQNHQLNCTNEDFICTLTTHTIIASDGSVKDSHGSFAWVLAHTKEQILASGSCTAFSYQVTSFRSEAN